MLQYLHACECVHTYAHTAHLFPDFAYGTGQDAVITQGELSSPTDFGFETPVSAKRNHESLKKCLVLRLRQGMCKVSFVYLVPEHRGVLKERW